jgi:hypothetical protein
MHDMAPQGATTFEPRLRIEPATWGTRDGALSLSTLLVVGAAFAVYLVTALYLDARDGTSYFGADPDYYEVLARHTYDDTAARFHPSTVLLGLGWMKLFAPFEAWIAPHVTLKMMFAAVGALGVLGAITTFNILLPRGYGLFAGTLYASSLGVWYFAAIPESKILTASLSALYIAIYVRYRDDWNVWRTTGLNAVLAVACFNEIVAGFLIAIPAVDALLRGLNWSRVRWIGIQVAVALAMLIVLELVVNGGIVPKSTASQDQSHFALFLAYFARFRFDLGKFHDFAANWFFFNLVAPTPYALWWPQTGGYFEPRIMAYAASPLAYVAISLVAAMIVVGLASGARAASFGPADGLLLPLAAYAIVRAIFFILFVPNEALLFSPAVTLPHWLFVLVPFAASRLPGKRAVLAVLCVLLIVVNAGFMVGPTGWPALWGWMAGA